MEPPLSEARRGRGSLRGGEVGLKPQAAIVLPQFPPTHSNLRETESFTERVQRWV